MVRSRTQRDYVEALEQLRPRLDYDAQFAQTIAGKPVVLGFAFPEEAQEVGLLPAPVFRTSRRSAAGAIPIRPERGYIANLHALQEAAAGAGHLDPVFDADGLVRRVPLLKAFGDGFYPDAEPRAGARWRSTPRRCARASTATAISMRSTSAG